MQVTGESLRDPALVDLVHSRVMAPRRERIREVICAGQASGELRADIVADDVMPLLVGPMLYLGIWSGSPRAREVSVEDVVDMVLSGLTRATGS